MGKIFKYFIGVTLAIAALIGYATQSDSSTITSQSDVVPTEIEVLHLSSSTPNFDLNLPNQTCNISNVLNAHNTVERARYGHKNSTEYVKSGKVINLCIGSFVQQESFNIQHRFVKSASWLISIGILII